MLGSICDTGMDVGMIMESLVAVLDIFGIAAGGVEEGADDSIGAVAGLAHPKTVNMIRRTVGIVHFNR